MNPPIRNRQAFMEAQLAEAQEQLAVAAEALTSASMSLLGVLVEGGCRESAKLESLSRAIATQKHLVVGLAELVAQVPRPDMQVCTTTPCDIGLCPYDPPTT